MIGRTLGPYEILAPLGAGGMGEVYRARDPRLGREVAIKVLPEAAAGDADRLLRLEREARAASALNHPNIVTIHDIGDHEGTLYVAMEYVEGKTLREMLREQPLPAKRLLQLATQIADGLAKAHSAGIVHRDLKPENLMVTADGLVKILDFGLAKVVLESPETDSEAKTVTRATREGAVLGTVQYMSPEQAAGRPVDYRSDQFSFGSILYEMATGKLAYLRDTGPETQAAIMRDEPEPVSALNPHVPAQLAHIVGRCLEKDPKDRYDSTRDLARELESVDESRRPGSPTSRRLRLAGLAVAGLVVLLVVAAVALFTGGGHEWLAGASSPPRIDSLAVLPLENLSGDPEQDYFVDGMHEELITRLSQISALKVISRGSVMQYRGAPRPLPDIARELDVGAVIEGTVRRGGNQVRITVHLIDAATGQQLFAESYQRELRDVLALQSDVAQAITREVNVTLTPEEQVQLASTHPVDPEAYELSLKGHFQLGRFTEDGFRKAVEHFQKAIDVDPAYAPSYAGLSLAYLRLGSWHTSVLPTTEIRRDARSAAEKALELDENLAEAHIALGRIRQLHEWDWQGAERAFRRGIELDPSATGPRVEYANYLTAMGRFEESIAIGRRTVAIDPLSPASYNELGWALWHAGLDDEALEQYRKGLELDPDFLQSHILLSLFYLGENLLEEAIEHATRVESFVGEAGPPLVLGWVGNVYARAGRRGDAIRILKDLKRRAENEHVPAAALADIHLGLGENEEALAFLERAYEEESVYLVWLKVHPTYDPLRNDPRFQNLLSRMNFPQ